MWPRELPGVVTIGFKGEGYYMVLGFRLFVVFKTGFSGT